MVTGAKPICRESAEESGRKRRDAADKPAATTTHKPTAHKPTTTHKPDTTTSKKPAGK